jgi:hypothetical protein
VQYRISCSFVQLYSEKLTDLLTRRDGLKLRYGSHGNFAIDGLRRSECDSSAQAQSLFLQAIGNKAMGSHALNQQSSRSHCIYTFHIVQYDPTTPDHVLRSDLSLVDLAGSERLFSLGEAASAKLLKESIDINTSLLALGKVITALALRSKQGESLSGQPQHVPYRDSKLTRLLQHALGGNAMTTMIACIAPVDAYVDETTSTLLYAGRARNIKNDPRVNEDPRGALIRQLRDEIASLKIELGHYRALALDGGRGIDALGSTRPTDEPQDDHDTMTSDVLVLTPLASASGALPAAGPATSAARREPTEPATAARTIGGVLRAPVPANATAADVAGKLYAACVMLRDVVKVNGELRDAFDRVLTAKRQGEAREVDLHAENLALRERIEVLESIALEADNDDGTTAVEAEPLSSFPLHDNRRPRRASQANGAAEGPRAAGTSTTGSDSDTDSSAPAAAPNGGNAVSVVHYGPRHSAVASDATAADRRRPSTSGVSTPVKPSVARDAHTAFSRGGNTPSGAKRVPSPTPDRAAASTPSNVSATASVYTSRPFAAPHRNGHHHQQRAPNSQPPQERKRARLAEYDAVYRLATTAAPAHYDRYYALAQRHQQLQEPRDLTAVIDALRRGVPSAAAAGGDATSRSAGTIVSLNGSSAPQNASGVPRAATGSATGGAVARNGVIAFGPRASAILGDAAGGPPSSSANGRRSGGGLPGRAPTPPNTDAGASSSQAAGARGFVADLMRARATANQLQHQQRGGRVSSSGGRGRV